MISTTLLKAESGMYYHNGNVYAKIVRVRTEWTADWKLAKEDEAKEAKDCRKFNRVMHIHNREL